MMDERTAGRTLALNLAAAESQVDAHNLLQQHIDAYEVGEAALIFAMALEAVTVHILHPAVAGTDKPAEFRQMYRKAAMDIIAGPEQEEK